MVETQIIKNCLPPSLFKNIQNRLTDFDNLPFFFAVGTAYHPEMIQDSSEPLVGDNLDSSFSNVVFDYDEGYRSQNADILHDAILVACDKAGRKIDTILRIRIGLITGATETLVHDKHVDYCYHHTTGLLYINDTDGDTILYSEKYDETSDKGVVEQSDGEMSVAKRISPEENKVVFFDGSTFHSSSTPTKTAYRMVVNFNFIEESDG